jgi:hypothetical protein
MSYRIILNSIILAVYAKHTSSGLIFSQFILSARPSKGDADAVKNEVKSRTCHVSSVSGCHVMSYHAMFVQ